MRGYGGNPPRPENRSTQEWHFFFQNTLRWRNLRKVTVAQVRHRVRGRPHADVGVDLIVAADDASFADVVGTRLAGAESSTSRTRGSSARDGRRR